MFHISFLELVLGRFVTTTILSNDVCRMEKEQADGTEKVRTNIKVMVVYTFPEMASEDRTQLENLRFK